ncbi:VOC family protein [Brevibacterium paucivorans]|uniref:VOC family protein n=1 Tax=Brevibacterium paucivorans TaxID=170994 RepID=UPI0025FB1D34|nr:VOC family protein [uncultured Brevibacterium sp.]
MHLDHLSFAAQSDGYQATAERLAEKLGLSFYDGGVHPRFGTRNLIFPLTGGHYVEVVEALEHPAALATPYGQAVRARSELGGGWMGWCVRTDDLASVEERLGRKAVDGNRQAVGGPELEWKQIGVKGLMADPQLPYFIHWLSPTADHPAHWKAPSSDVAIKSLQIAGNRDRVRDWLGTDDPKPIPEIGIDWTAPNAAPGLISVTFTTPQGEVVV